MVVRLSDTSPEVHARMLEIYARMTPGEKFHRVMELCEVARAMALAGLRSEHPHASERELLRLLALRVHRGRLSVPSPSLSPGPNQPPAELRR